MPILRYKAGEEARSSRSLGAAAFLTGSANVCWMAEHMGRPGVSVAPLRRETWLCHPAALGMVPHCPAMETSSFRVHQGDINSSSITTRHSWVKSSVQSRTGVPQAGGTLGILCSQFPSHLMLSARLRFARRQQHPASILHGQRRLRVLDVSPNSGTFCSFPKSGSLPGIREKCHL